jgi:coproporphyrinogen III oxidase-like Fe-S oxidoreductase
MSDFCECCDTNAAYVQEHLNWNVADSYTPEEIQEFTHEDWVNEARECMTLWKAGGEPIRMSEEKLAELLEEIYGASA